MSSVGTWVFKKLIEILITIGVAVKYLLRRIIKGARFNLNSGFAHIGFFSPLRRLGSLSLTESIKYHERRVEIARKRIKFIEQAFFIEKQLNHSKDVLDHHLKYRTYVVGFSSQSSITIKIDLNDQPPAEYEAYREDCNMHLASDKYEGTLKYESKAVSAIKTFNNEVEELINNIIITMGSFRQSGMGKSLSPPHISRPLCKHRLCIKTHVRQWTNS